MSQSTHKSRRLFNFCFFSFFFLCTHYWKFLSSNPLIIYFWPDWLACRILVSWPGIEPLYWELGILTTGPPEKSLTHLSSFPFSLLSYRCSWDVRKHHELNEHEFEQTQGDRQWRTGEPGVLQSTGLQRVRHGLTNEQQHVLHHSIYMTFWKRQTLETQGRAGVFRYRGGGKV